MVAEVPVFQKSLLVVYRKSKLIRLVLIFDMGNFYTVFLSSIT